MDRCDRRKFLKALGVSAFAMSVGIPNDSLKAVVEEGKDIPQNYNTYTIKGKIYDFHTKKLIQRQDDEGEIEIKVFKIQSDPTHPNQPAIDRGPAPYPDQDYRKYPDYPKPILDDPDHPISAIIVKREGTYQVSIAVDSDSSFFQFVVTDGAQIYRRTSYIAAIYRDKQYWDDNIYQEIELAKIDKIDAIEKDFKKPFLSKKLKIHKIFFND